MKASELIEILKEVVRESGDMEITVLVDGFVAGSIRTAYATSDGDDIIIETES